MLSWLSLGVTKVARVGLCRELACYDSPFAKITLVALWKMDFREAERPFGSHCSNMVGDLGQCSYTSAGEMLNKLLPLPEHKTQTYLPATLCLSGAIQLCSYQCEYKHHVNSGPRRLERMSLFRVFFLSSPDCCFDVDA